MKVPVAQTKDFTLYLEQLDDCVVIHCDVWAKWSKLVKKHLTDCFQKLTTKSTEPIYALHAVGDEKHKKLLKMFGFERQGDILGVDGNKYDIYVWR